ncbi:endoplasmic reticulum protein 29 [Perkinsus olseni]|uniref:40S ribosomal protein S12 n=1 Tax=Perkinsus olseni TaxID=32597 RepID=A0A7J6MY55_PEROL|nr:endoplasmic reticulum protein 29 [Perkinsus olseni]
MSDIDAAEEIDQPIEVEEAVTDLNSAIRRVLKNAIAVDGLLRGLHETAKALEAGRANVCFLASSCNEDNYKKLIQALCLEQNVPLIEVPDNKQLGEWAGLCKIDKDGNPRKVVGASVVAVTNYASLSDIVSIGALVELCASSALALVTNKQQLYVYRSYMSVGNPSPSFLTLPLLVLFLGMGLATGLSFNGALSLDAMVFDKVISSNKYHVLVRFDKSDTDGSNEMNFGELVEASQKLKNLLLAYVDIESDEQASDKLDLAKKYGADKFPTYVLFSDGKEVSKYHDGKEVTDISDLIKWLEDNGIHLALKGRTLPLLDRLVQEYFSSDSSERKAELLKEVKASSDQYKEHDLAKFYPTILEKVSGKGDEYCTKELTRITSMLDKTKDSISEDKREEMRGKTQVLNVCKAAAEAASKSGDEL